MRSPEFWWKRTNKVISLLNFIPNTIVNLKNLFINPYRPNLKVLCVGNFTIGGAGKTPMVRFLRKLLEKEGISCAVMLRGYKGSKAGPLTVDIKTHSYKEVGDEALLHSKDGLTIVSKNRVKGSKYAEDLGIDVLILDDGFQNPSITKDCNLLVVSSTQGVGNSLTFPFGPLRESLENTGDKVDILVKAKFSEVSHFSFDIINKYFNNIVDADFVTVIDSNLTDYVVLFAGIGDPQKLIDSVKNKCKKLHVFIKDDHGPINERTAKDILEVAYENNADILTTEKDIMRLLHSEDGSYGKELLLKSKMVKLNVVLDEQLLLQIIKRLLV